MTPQRDGHRAPAALEGVVAEELGDEAAAGISFWVEGAGDCSPSREKGPEDKKNDLNAGITAKWKPASARSGEGGRLRVQSDETTVLRIGGKTRKKHREQR